MILTDPRRRSADRWVKLSALLNAVERGVEAAARLDAYTPAVHQAQAISHAVHSRRAFNDQLLRLEARIDQELDRLTVERLTLDLAAKQRSQVA